jgi:hypothetical protein
MATTIVPFLIMIVGAGVYAVSTNGKVQELGRGAYWIGLFWVLYAIHGKVFHI